MVEFNRMQKMKLEKLFEMESGYVLDFSDRIFHDFFMTYLESTSTLKYMEPLKQKG